jgi:hypothetical protein
MVKKMRSKKISKKSFTKRTKRTKVSKKLKGGASKSLPPSLRSKTPSTSLARSKTPLQKIGNNPFSLSQTELKEQMSKKEYQTTAIKKRYHQVNNVQTRGEIISEIRVKTKYINEAKKELRTLYITQQRMDKAWFDNPQQNNSFYKQKIGKVNKEIEYNKRLVSDYTDNIAKLYKTLNEPK